MLLAADGGDRRHGVANARAPESAHSSNSIGAGIGIGRMLLKFELATCLLVEKGRGHPGEVPLDLASTWLLSFSVRALAAAHHDLADP